ncbi:Asp23/Gls24 family envelope stress response protein, partial [Eubacteriales bacterium OttesenSCG-928-N14]|nr:Asp23/Gls24 family envelope stress response protein [Eubacteriales bacterium OttesenSCG-928-N14]
ATLDTKTMDIDDKVMQKIVSESISGVDGVLGMHGGMMSGIAETLRIGDEETRGISTKMKDNTVQVHIKLISEFGKNIPTMIEQIQHNVEKNIVKMTGYEVPEVKVEVVDTMTKEEYNEKYNKDKNSVK